MEYTNAIDITGNWHEGAAPAAHLVTREPDVGDGETRTFRQSVRLPAGEFALEVEYHVAADRQPGRAVGGDPALFRGMKISGREVDCHLAPSREGRFRVGTVTFAVEQDATLELEQAVCATRPLRTRLRSEAALPHSGRFRAIRPTGDGQHFLLRGIPFRATALDATFLAANLDLRPRVAVRPFPERGEGWTLSCGGVRAHRIHLAGMISSFDLANGSWYSPKGDHGYSQFIGDRAGAVHVNWQDGSSEEVELIFGVNLWFGRPWDMLWHYAPYNPGGGYNCDDDLFPDAADARRQIEDAVRLVDGERTFGGLSNSLRYILTLETGGRALRGLRVSGDEKLHGFPLIGAITLETPDTGDLLPLPDVTAADPVVLPVGLDHALPARRSASVAALQAILYGNIDQLPELAEPQRPGGHLGPRFDFRGTPGALRAATFLHYNGLENAAHIADTGTGPPSSTARSGLTHYNTGMGVVRALEPYFGDDVKRRGEPNVLPSARDHLRPLYDGLEAFIREYHARAPGSLPGTGYA